jgi:hypothetical protein
MSEMGLGQGDGGGREIASNGYKVTRSVMRQRRDEAHVDEIAALLCSNFLNRDGSRLLRRALKKCGEDRAEQWAAANGRMKRKC